MPARAVVRIIALFATLALPPAAGAQQARIDIRINGVQACDFSWPGGIGTATVTVVNSFPFRAVRFKAVPPCGLVVLNTTSPYPFTGNPQTGVDISLPACTNAPVDVLQITFFAPAAVSGCMWDVLPYDGKQNIVLADCDGFLMKGASARSVYCGDVNAFIAPYRPEPADGATGVPVNTPLAFVGGSNEMYMRAGSPDNLVDYPICSVFFGSTACSNPFDPGPLQPNTTYYWRAGNWCEGCYHGEGALSDNWSFTTGAGPVATEQSTWGRVKALYRE
ncbi:MAG TPA: Ig-like domain-containing protein [Candidatus Krumholzibacteria bacterium]|nr:Ig-like domain-containing protein [Candidatus Krumholzibacteria bacterium]